MIWMETRKINEIIKKFNENKHLYPRNDINHSKIKEYEEYIGVMPPIIINQDDILLDGAHRLFANHNKEEEEIKVQIIETKDDDDIMLKAIELNATHGFQLTQQEKKKHITTLYKKVLENEAKSFDVKRLKSTFSVPDSTFSNWTKDLNDKLESLRLQNIIGLHLLCKTQQEIADEVGEPRRTISAKIEKIEENIKKLAENPDSELLPKFEFLREFVVNYATFGFDSCFLYNIWNVSKNTSNNIKFGRFPQEYMENLLYYYTEPFEVVYDPFAGGGVTIHTCKKWLRKYKVYDAFPEEYLKDQIPKWKIQDGLPENLPADIKLVFLDPPYWKQAEGKYSKDKKDLGNMELEEFYSSLSKFIKELKKKLKKGSYVALVIQATQWKTEGKYREDHAYVLMKELEKIGFKLDQRFILPYSTEQYNAQQVEYAKKNKLCLQIYRDLVVFKKV